MAQISVEIICLSGSLLRGDLQAEDRLHQKLSAQAFDSTLTAFAKAQVRKKAFGRTDEP